MGRFRVSLRHRLLAAYLAMLVPVVALLAYELYADYTRRVESILTDQAQTAGAVGAVIDAVFDEGLAVARAIAAEPELAQQDPTQIESYLRSRQETFRRYTSIGYVDSSGIVVASSTPIRSAPPLPSLADRPYFQRLMATGEETTSDVVLGRVSDVLVVAFAAPVRDRSGTLRGALIITLEVARLSERLAGIRLGPGQSIFVTDRNGRLGYHSNFQPTTWEERDLSALDPVRRASAGEVVVEESFHSPFLRDQRLAAFATSSTRGWVVGVTQNRDAALGPIFARIWRDVAASVGLVVLAVLLGATLSRRLLAPIQKLTTEARALGLGLGRPSDSSTELLDQEQSPPNLRIREDELSILTTTFARMAEEVRSRVEEVEASNARLSALMNAATTLVMQTSQAEVAEVGVASGRQILGDDFAGLWVLTGGDDVLRLLGACCLAAPAIEELRSIPCASDMPIAQAVRARMLVAVDHDVDHDSEADLSAWSLVRDGGLQRLIAVPLSVRRGIVGAVAFGRRQARDYTQAERRAAETLAGMLAVALDRAEAFDDLRVALRVREDFLNLAAHELKTPLTTLKGYVQLLDRRADHSLDERKLIEALNNQSNRMRHLVEALIDVSQLQSGSLELHARPVDLGELAAGVVGELARPQPRHTVTLRREGDAVVPGDRARIRGVIFSLVDNALKYSPRGGTVEVTVTATPEEGTVSVRDEGIGIPREKREELFHAFYQVAPMVRPTTGMGLGLYISREIVQRHGGRIWFESKEGVGSTFSFALPRGPGGASVEAGRDAATPLTAGEG